MFVRTPPGTIVFTRMFQRASSTAAIRPNTACPAFAVEYAE